MKKLLLILLIIPAQLFSQPNSTNKKADSLFTRLMAASRPQVKNWVYGTAGKYRNKEVNETILKSNNEFGVLGNMNGADIDALAFLVMMQASKDAESDLKAIMNDVKKVNKEKEQQRQQMQKMDSLKSANRKNKDNLQEMGQMEQLRLQMYMDRRQKAMETISNLMKKVAATESSIIQNLK